VSREHRGAGGALHPPAPLRRERGGDGAAPVRLREGRHPDPRRRRDCRRRGGERRGPGGERPPHRRRRGRPSGPAAATAVSMAPPGLLLPNRGVVIGAVKAGELLDLAGEADGGSTFDTVWVGDSLLAKPRVEAVTLLGALAGATRRVRLGVGAPATFV